MGDQTVLRYITLTSDFGIDSQGVGAMKAVIHRIAPESAIIDLTHGVTPFSIIEGACEMEAVSFLPADGVHVCVVDPGVGSDREVVAIATSRGDVLVGPDNGVLVLAARALGGASACHIVSNPDVLPDTVTLTFHGRDVMAPAAAAVAAGLAVADLGPAVPFDHLVAEPYGEADLAASPVRALVIHINRYGTAYLNVRNNDLAHSDVGWFLNTGVGNGVGHVEVVWGEV